MRQRIIFATVCATVALFILCARYAPPHIAVRSLGDPTTAGLSSGFEPAELDRDVVVRRSLAASTLRVPLPDSRGAQTVALRFRTDTGAAGQVSLGDLTLQLPSATSYRSYTLLAPPVAQHSLLVGLAPTAGDAVVLSEIVVRGRGGRPPALDLLQLLLIALLPAALLLLTLQLPRDWAITSALLTVAALAALPAADWGALLSFGPLATLTAAAVAGIPFARRHPGAALVVLFGAALRVYALGWGAGYGFGPGDAALMAGQSRGFAADLAYGTARLLQAVSGAAGWGSGWGAVLIARAWSAVAGAALIAVVYALGLLLLRRRWALLAAGFVACAPVLVQQSHMAGAAVWTTLLVAMLVLLSTWALAALSARATLLALLVSVALVWTTPAATVWLAVPLVAHLALRGRRAPFVARSAALVALVLLGGLRWSDQTVALAAGVQSAPLGTTYALPYLYPLFNMLLWGVGPLLMQLGLVGWGLGSVRAFRERAERRWIPLLLGSGLAFAAVGHGPAFALDALLPLVPCLALTAALLLQTFSRRLHFAFGRRTVRLLACTALGLALATSLGLINVYRAPDARVAASRWLVGRLDPDGLLLLDVPAAQTLPLGVPGVVAGSPVDFGSATAGAAELASALARGSFVVTALERADETTPEWAALDPSTACRYNALFTGQLGYLPRASFTGQPRIGSWTIDDRWADASLRVYDHPRLHVFERVGAVDAATLERALRC